MHIFHRLTQACESVFNELTKVSVIVSSSGNQNSCMIYFLIKPLELTKSHTHVIRFVAFLLLDLLFPFAFRAEENAMATHLLTHHNHRARCSLLPIVKQIGEKEKCWQVVEERENQGEERKEESLKKKEHTRLRSIKI